MIRHQIARILSALADRLEPSTRACSHPCAVCSNHQISSALADIISGRIVGHSITGRAFTSTSHGIARY